MGIAQISIIMLSTVHRADNKLLALNWLVSSYAENDEGTQQSEFF